MLEAIQEEQVRWCGAYCAQAEAPLIVERLTEFRAEIHEEIRLSEAEEEERKRKQAADANTFPDLSEIEKGARVWHVVFSRYGTVTRKNVVAGLA